MKNIIFEVSAILAGLIVAMFFGGIPVINIIYFIIIFFSLYGLVYYLNKRFDIRKYLFYLLPVTAIASIVFYGHIKNASLPLLIIVLLLFVTRSNKEVTLENLKSMGIKKKVYEPKSWNKFVGGFVSPVIFPKKIFINKYFNRRKEADIHEAVHQFLLFERGWLFYYFGIILFSVIAFVYLFNIDEHLDLIVTLVTISIAISCMVYFEYATFNITKKLYNKAKAWDRQIFFKYVIIYIIQMGIVVSLFYGVSYLLRLL